MQKAVPPPWRAGGVSSLWHCGMCGVAVGQSLAMRVRPSEIYCCRLVPPIGRDHYVAYWSPLNRPVAGGPAVSRGPGPVIESSLAKIDLYLH